MKNAMLGLLVLLFSSVGFTQINGDATAAVKNTTYKKDEVVFFISEAGENMVGTIADQLKNGDTLILPAFHMQSVKLDWRGRYLLKASLTEKISKLSSKNMSDSIVKGKYVSITNADKSTELGQVEAIFDNGFLQIRLSRNGVLRWALLAQTNTSLSFETAMPENFSKESMALIKRVGDINTRLVKVEAALANNQLIVRHGDSLYLTAVSHLLLANSKSELLGKTALYEANEKVSFDPEEDSVKIKILKEYPNETDLTPGYIDADFGDVVLICTYKYEQRVGATLDQIITDTESMMNRTPILDLAHRNCLLASKKSLVISEKTYDLKEKTNSFFAPVVQLSQSSARSQISPSLFKYKTLTCAPVKKMADFSNKMSMIIFSNTRAGGKILLWDVGSETIPYYTMIPTDRIYATKEECDASMKPQKDEKK